MGAGPAGGRWHAVDHVKAAAIVAVVFQHAGQVAFDSWGSPTDFVLTSLWTSFHVPSFLLVSGFLYARTSGVPWADVVRRLARILLPYLVASGVAISVGLAVTASSPPWLRWPTAVRGPGDVAWQLATASALGIYYYVFVLSLCLPLVWPLSRAGRALPWALWVSCGALLLAIDLGVVARPSLHLSSWLPGDVFFWAPRDPLEAFSLGYFVTGWLAALGVERLSGWRVRRGVLCAGLATAGVLLGWAAFGGLLPFPLGSTARVIYTFSVVALLALATANRPAGPVVRFLADATLALYLYHRIFQLLAQPITDEWPALLRIGGQVVVGLLGASAVVWSGRRLLGSEGARRLLGA